MANTKKMTKRDYFNRYPVQVPPDRCREGFRGA